MTTKTLPSLPETPAGARDVRGPAFPLATGSEIRVAKSAMTDRIYAGRVCKDGMTWRDGKRDVTSDVLKAVVDLITPGHALTVSVDGKPAYEITVKALSPNQ